MKSQIKIYRKRLSKYAKTEDIDITHMDNEGCHRLPLGRNTTNTAKQVIVKFVKRKHSEAMLQSKKNINKKVRFL